MVPVLNDVGTMCAVFGNHDFGMVNFYFIFSACHAKGAVQMMCTRRVGSVNSVRCIYFEIFF